MKIINRILKMIGWGGGKRTAMQTQKLHWTQSLAGRKKMRKIAKERLANKRRTIPAELSEKRRAASLIGWAKRRAEHAVVEIPVVDLQKQEAV